MVSAATAVGKSMLTRRHSAKTEIGNESHMTPCKISERWCRDNRSNLLAKCLDRRLDHDLGDVGPRRQCGDRGEHRTDVFGLQDLGAMFG